MRGLVGRAWIPLVLVVVLAVSGLIVMRLHKVFGSQDLNANAGAGIEIVQFNPKIVVYDVLGPAGTSARIDYYDADANTYELNAALPWSTTISTTLPAVSRGQTALKRVEEIGPSPDPVVVRDPRLALGQVESIVR